MGGRGGKELIEGEREAAVGHKEGHASFAGSTKLCRRGRIQHVTLKREDNLGGTVGVDAQNGLERVCGDVEAAQCVDRKVINAITGYGHAGVIDQWEPCVELNGASKSAV
eukprot:CAMPEP_0184643926 /NCGR_PEP_ID=MMETSP0308-20130426/733_1 /TAXON_ID=38269 /ORGANISM="Gloeochaete witrockiana, Strain SAG 46.84" /LENGTH=109 /DNA_ID=CAMNT_0027072193 /DNA_START=219 /DNA_END=548 /DNA_ORIENTATION=-